MGKIYLLMLSFITMGFSSCNMLQDYYQICEVSSNLSSTLNGNFEYHNSVCAIEYDFWGDGGNAGFVVKNTSDEILYIDLSKSFFVINDIAYDYFLDRTVSTYKSYETSLTSARSATAYGFWSSIGGLGPGSLSVSKNSGATSAKSSSIETKEKMIVAVPPHALKVINEYKISPSYFYNCDYNITPSKKQHSSYSYTKSTSPIAFGNFITYYVGEKDKEYHITNDFYVSRTIYLHKKAATEKIETGCPNDKNRTLIVKDRSPQKFFITYKRDKFSNDSKEGGFELGR